METFARRVVSPREVSPALAAFVQAPIALGIEGPPVVAPLVAIVGSREADEPARDFAFELARELVRHGLVVGSGGARGIDAAAHEGALAATGSGPGGSASAGKTLAVLPTGWDHVYPKRHASLYTRIVEAGGTLLWPFPPETRAHPSHFFLRNGVLAALSFAVVLVQAGIPSGALNTTAWARRMGRPVFAVAGPPWHERLRGGATDVALGARIVVSRDALVRELVGMADAGCAAALQPCLPFDEPGVPSSSLLSSSPTPSSPTPSSPTSSSPTSSSPTPSSPTPSSPSRGAASELTADHEAVLAACRGAPRHRDEIAARCRLGPSRLATVVLELELLGLLREATPGHLVALTHPGTRTA